MAEEPKSNQMTTQLTSQLGETQQPTPNPEPKNQQKTPKSSKEGQPETQTPKNEPLSKAGKEGLSHPSDNANVIDYLNSGHSGSKKSFQSGLELIRSGDNNNKARELIMYEEGSMMKHSTFNGLPTLEENMARPNMYMGFKIVGLAAVVMTRHNSLAERRRRQELPRAAPKRWIGHIQRFLHTPKVFEALTVITFLSMITVSP